MPSNFALRHIGPDDVSLVDQLLSVFGEAFEDHISYSSARPKAEYMKRLLHSDYFIALVALSGESVVGGLAAYELKKFEQERSEVYIYDLAVAEPYRRAGIATELISSLKRIAAARGAYVIFVQAGPGDDPAIALYTKLGAREDVLHFDIPTT